MPPSAPWVEEFTLPGLNQTLGADRLIKEVQLKIINKTTTKELQAYLGSYGLPISGPNKGVLVDRLRTYANDREQGIGRKKTYSEYYIVSYCDLDSSSPGLSAAEIEPETEYPSKRVALLHTGWVN
ncbi:hypothetical protein B0H17DRAFT_1134474 [Mycena rosella]|uniref:SAP domain-containing protein n=1 Tax=Mycena rosella TaxID=1033263 RepID=A0AAD7GIY9_MYCRO|nr:hypothetical protein B0H17DRAFT_1134474 [Mycena rosella]